MHHRVLLTGAAGMIGGHLRGSLRGTYPVLRLSDRAPLGEAADGEEICPADLTDAAAVAALVEGCDAVVHMGAVAKEAPWDDILQNNIIATYNIFEAARLAKVKRMVFASALHVTGFYRCDRRVEPTMPVRPDSRYGVSKVFGENVGRLYADKYNVPCVCLRIGTFSERPRGRRMLSTWISPRDFTHLVRCALDAPDIHYEVLYGVSNNDRRWWDNPAAARIGYAPQDNSERYALSCVAGTTLRELTGKGDPSMRDGFHKLFQGAKTAWTEFAGDISKID
jgi:uronate dehydrogenase